MCTKNLWRYAPASHPWQNRPVSEALADSKSPREAGRGWVLWGSAAREVVGGATPSRPGDSSRKTRIADAKNDLDQPES